MQKMLRKQGISTAESVVVATLLAIAASLALTPVPTSSGKHGTLVLSPCRVVEARLVLDQGRLHGLDQPVWQNSGKTSRQSLQHLAAA